MACWRWFPCTPGFCLVSVWDLRPVFTAHISTKTWVFITNRVTNSQMISQPDEFQGNDMFKCNSCSKRDYFGFKTFSQWGCCNVEVWFCVVGSTFGLCDFGGGFLRDMPIIGCTTNLNHQSKFSSLENCFLPKRWLTQGCCGSVRLDGWWDGTLGLGVFSCYQVVWSGDITLNYNAEVRKLGWFLRTHDVNGKAVFGSSTGLFEMTDTEISQPGFQHVTTRIAFATFVSGDEKLNNYFRRTSIPSNTQEWT